MHIAKRKKKKEGRKERQKERKKENSSVIDKHQFEGLYMRNAVRLLRIW